MLINYQCCTVASDLELKLKDGQHYNPEHTFIVTDGIFSMDGSIADIM